MAAYVGVRFALHLTAQDTDIATDMGAGSQVGITAKDGKIAFDLPFQNQIPAENRQIAVDVPALFYLHIAIEDSYIVIERFTCRDSQVLIHDLLVEKGITQAIRSSCRREEKR